MQHDSVVIDFTSIVDYINSFEDCFYKIPTIEIITRLIKIIIYTREGEGYEFPRMEEENEIDLLLVSDQKLRSEHKMLKKDINNIQMMILSHIKDVLGEKIKTFTFNKWLDSTSVILDIS